MEIKTEERQLLADFKKEPPVVREPKAFVQEVKKNEVKKHEEEMLPE